MYTGSCLCGGVCYEIDGRLEPIQVCHCSQCRKAQGSALVTNIPVSIASFRLTTGADLLSAFESSPGKLRFFCKVCGSPIYSEHVNLPGVVRIRAGTLNGDLETRPVAHFYYASRANWFEINDNIPKFPDAYTARKP